MPGKNIETRGHIVGFQEAIEQSANIAPDAFFTWFNSSADAEEAFVRGQWDFSLHVALPLAPYLKNPHQMTVLEIGCGGGRILAAASRAFRQAVGVDIHNQMPLVEGELRRRGISNLTLHQTEGKTIPCSNASIDVVYSFIVLQHVEKIDIFKQYVQETYRVLKPQGVAILYFARKHYYSYNQTATWRLMLDRVLSDVTLLRHGGYQEIPAPVNSVNLRVSLRYAKALARQQGFEILGHTVSRKQVPDGVAKYGGQYALILRK